jgi:pimeloyl-ACP methyl ester carboxylesterase
MLPVQPRPPRPVAAARTTVRFFVRRLALGTLARVAPATAERAALELFRRPLRFSVPRDPDPPGRPPHRFTISSPAGPLAAWDWGDGPTVLLAHGWAGQAAQLSSFVAPLLDAGFHVATFDQPAHGQSAGRRSDVVGFAEAIRTVAARLAPIHGIIGHSLGATATALALRQGLAVERAVLLAPPSDSAPFAQAFARACGLTPACAQGVVERARRHIVESAGPLADTSTARVLVLHDADDAEVPLSHGHAVAAAFPRGRLVRLSGLGHRKLLRDSAVVQAAVGFLDDTADAALVAL